MPYDIFRIYWEFRFKQVRINRDPPVHAAFISRPLVQILDRGDLFRDYALKTYDPRYLDLLKHRGFAQFVNYEIPVSGKFTVITFMAVSDQTHACVFGFAQSKNAV